MKTRLLSLFALLIVTFTSKAQYVTIPDTAFVTWLNLNGYSTCLNGNQMDTTCPDIINEDYIYMSRTQVQDLDGIQYFKNIYFLSCDYNFINNIPAFPASLETIVLNDNELTSLPPLPPILTTLLCSNNRLTSMPAFPNTIYEFEARSNQLATWSTIPSSMRIIDVHENFLNTWPVLPDSLESLDVSTNFSMTAWSIPTLPIHLQKLNISEIYLSTIAPLPPDLKTFIARYVFGANTFPSVPASVTELDCSGNYLISLPPLPTGLLRLTCDRNSFSQIQSLPSNLTYLSCAYSNVDSLYTLPAGLETLDCSNNYLTALPNLPTTLRNLNCSFNYLEALPALPDTMDILDCSSNSIGCLSKLVFFSQLHFNNTGVRCLPNYPVVTNYSNPALNTVPICDVSNNPNGCTIDANLTGFTFIDTMPNCWFNSNEIRQHNIKTSLYSSNALLRQTITGSEGYFSFDLGYGNYEIRIDTTNTPFTVTCPGGTSFFDTISAADSTTYNINFALRCKGGFDLAAHSISSPMRFIPGRLTYVNIQAGDLANFFNGNCAYGVSGVITAIIDGPARYIAPLGNSLAPTSVNGDTLKWNIADFDAIQGGTDFYIVVETDTSATAGSTVCLTLDVTPHSDNDSTNNVTTTCYTVVSSFDPNDKQVSPPGDIDTLQKWLTYTVRFQNTGTAEAQHIYIMDTLSAHIDASTFQLLAYSHQPQVLINENIVRFNFANINLPDSNANEPESHGFIQYKVKLKDNLPVGTTINNTAFIYFDFNAPVVTNTTASTIAIKQDTVTVSVPNVSSAVQFSLYPNPTQQHVTISTTQPNQTLQIFDIEGRIVFTQNIIGTATAISVESMASGVYVVGLSNTSVRKRLVKL